MTPPLAPTVPSPCVVINGDLFDVLPTLAAESFHACVTDPPYGLGFMGKEWDTFKPGVAESRIVPNRAIQSDNPNLNGRTRGPASSPSAVEYDRTLGGQKAFQDWNERWAREVYRVLKPGAYLLVCGAPRSYHRMACGLEDAGFEIRDCFAWLFGQGFPKSLNFPDGWGTALKPANEPIVIARKPFKGSVEANRAQHGTGGINVEACRLETEDNLNGGGYAEVGGRAPWADSDSGMFRSGRTAGREFVPPDGRWPSNVLLDEIAAGMLDEAVGDRRSAGDYPSAATSSGMFGQREQGQLYADAGGPSRFFYVAKPDRAERDRGCEGLTVRKRDESRKDGNPGGDNPRNRGLQPRGNHHPTVKPVDLMRWLVRLVTPAGGRVLDPFCGSGTTGMACEYEGVEFVGIEKEAAYVQIAECRIADVLPLLRESAPPHRGEA